MTEDKENPQLFFRRRFKKEIREVANEEKSLVDEGASPKDNVWEIYEGKVIDHDGSFSEILKTLGYESLRVWMRQRKEAGLTTHILDVMGGNGSFLRDLGKFGDRGREVNPDFDKSLVITLANERATWEKWQKEDNRRRVSIVAGDITSGKTWQSVSEWLNKESIPAFDLVICRGVQGVDLIPILLYGAMLERFYKNTTNQNGIILAQVSFNANKQLNNWNHAFNQIPGIKFFTQPERRSALEGWFSAGAGYPAVGLVKTEKAPPSITTFVKNMR